jgi:REP element-mobilizing transposase RayT
MEDIRFLNPDARVNQHANRLPHWQQDGVTYFATFRLADSIPVTLLDQWRGEREAWLRVNPPPWTTEKEQDYHQRFSAAVEHWLDEAHGACVLRNPAASRALSEVLNKFDNMRYRQHSWIIMPNHVHVLFSLCGESTLPGILQGWKGASARAINLVLGSTGTLWQKDYFDRLVRDATHFWKCVRYIRYNPVKAKLNPQDYLLHESNFVRSVE